MKPIWSSLIFIALPGLALPGGLGCGGSKSSPPTTSATMTAPADDGALVEARAKASDGVELVYDTRGNPPGDDDTTLVFVHCWSCDRTYWKNQVDEFAKDYRVVTLDLGGHGQSGDTRSAWTLASLGADVQTVVEAVDAKRVILIGHSMGGPVALEAAKRMPGRVVGVACADTLHDVDRTMPAPMKEQILKAFETDFAGTMKQGMSFMFRPTSPKEVVDFVNAKAALAKPEVAVPLMRELMNLELGPLLASAKVPIRCVNAAPAGPMAPKTNVEANKKHADFDAVIIEDVGHFLQLEKPDEFNAKLRVILTQFK